MKIWLDGEGGATGGEGGQQTGQQGGEGGQQTGQQGGTFTIPADYDFRAMLPEDIRNDVSLDKFNTAKGPAFIEQLVRSNIGAQKLVGADPSLLVKLPADGKMSQEDRLGLLRRVGLPDPAKNADAWALKPIKDAPKGYEHDAPLAKWLSDSAAKLGIFPEQAQQLFEGFVGQAQQWTTEQAARQGAADKANIDALQKEYGPAFDGEHNAAKYAVSKLGGKDLAERIERAGLGTDPVLFKALAQIGKMLSESDTGGDKPNFNSGEAPAAVMEKFNAKNRESLEALASGDAGKARRLAVEAQEILSGHYGKK